MSDDDSDDIVEKFEVEKIISKRKRKNITEFYVKYQNYDDDYNMWLRKDQLDCFMLEEFEQHEKDAKKSHKVKPSVQKMAASAQQEISNLVVDNNIHGQTSETVSKSQGIFVEK